MYFNIVDFHTNRTVMWLFESDWDEASKTAKRKEHYLKKEFGCELFYIVEMSDEEREECDAISRKMIDDVYRTAGTAD